MKKTLKFCGIFAIALIVIYLISFAITKLVCQTNEIDETNVKFPTNHFSVMTNDSVPIDIKYVIYYNINDSIDSSFICNYVKSHIYDSLKITAYKYNVEEISANEDAFKNEMITNAINIIKNDDTLKNTIYQLDIYICCPSKK